MAFISEICCGSLNDCLVAKKAKAKRIELNSALFLGGLTPSIATLVLAKEKIDIPIICMIRPRGAGFNYDENEWEEIKLSAKLLLEHGADGLAFGFLDKDGGIDYKRVKWMTDLIHSYNKEAVFHRAFDCTDNPYIAIEALIELKVDRILTSGQRAKAIDGTSLIKDLINKYSNKIEIILGSGINAENILDLYQKTQAKQFHGSNSTYKIDNTSYKGDVDYRYSQLGDYEAVDYAKALAFCKTIENIEKDIK